MSCQVLDLSARPPTNFQIGRRVANCGAGSAMSEDETVPNPVFDTMLMASNTVPAGSWLRSQSSSCHALQSPVSGSGVLASFQRGRNQRMRLLLRSLRSDAVIIE